jgi:acetyl esterase/lipase
VLLTLLAPQSSGSTDRTVTVTAPSVSASATQTEAVGNPSALLFRWNGLTVPSRIAYPGETGYGDVGSGTGSSRITGTHRLEIEPGGPTGRPTTSRQLETNDFPGGVDTFFWQIAPTANPGTSAVMPGNYTGAWSMRMMARFPSWATAMTFLSFRTGSTGNFSLFRTVSPARFARTGGGPSSATLPSADDWYRIEIQADPARTAKVVWRIYQGDSTTPVSGHQDTGVTDVSWDNVQLGSLTAGAFGSAYFAEVEVWADYDLGGQFTSNPAGTTPATTTATGAPSSTPVVGDRFRYSSTTNRTVARSTPVAGTDYTSYLGVDYVTGGTFNRKLDLYVPTRTAPAGGWPLIVWAHSGFFQAGSRSELPSTWRDDMLTAGYAVASVSYVRTSADVTIPTYDPYGSTDPVTLGPGFGRYPSFVLDYKRASAFLRDNAATWGVNPAKMIATGYSAGGYLALDAAMTRNLAADSAGTPMTLDAARAAGAAWATGLTAGIADPEYVACMVFCAPIDLDLARDWDPTHPNSGSIIRRQSYRAFQGLLASTTLDAPLYPRQAITSHIGLNSAANLCPVLYIRGTADFLVHWQHQAALKTAFDAKPGTSYTVQTTPNNHDRANDVYDLDAQLAWLNPIAYPSAGGTDQTVTAGAPSASAGHGAVTTAIVQDRTVTADAPSVTTTAGAVTTAIVQDRTVTADAPSVTAGHGAVTTAIVQDRTVTADAPSASAGHGAVTTAIVQDRTVTADAPSVTLAHGAATPSIGGDRTVTIDAPSVTLAHGAATPSIGGDRTVTIDAPSSSAAHGAVTVTITQDRTVTAGAPSVTTTAGAATTAIIQDRTVTAGAPSVTLAHGAATAAVNGDRTVTIDAPSVTASAGAVTVTITQSRNVTPGAPSLTVTSSPVTVGAGVVTFAYSDGTTTTSLTLFYWTGAAQQALTYELVE